MEKNKKIHLYFSIIMVLFVWSLLGGTLIFNAIDLTTFIVVAIAIILWPIIMLISFKTSINTTESKKAPVKLSIIGWVLLVTILLATNYMIDKEITWAIYPICGITIWPVGMVVYNLLGEKIKG